MAPAGKRGYTMSADSPAAPSPGNSNDSAIDSCSGSPDPPETTLSSSSSAPRKRKQVDKESDQYKARRERNNEAVRKSRAKSKLKRQHTDKLMRQLEDDKSALEQQVQTLQKELLLIRSWVQQPKDEPPEMDGQGVQRSERTFSVSSTSQK